MLCRVKFGAAYVVLAMTLVVQADFSVWDIGVPLFDAARAWFGVFSMTNALKVYLLVRRGTLI